MAAAFHFVLLTCTRKMSVCLSVNTTSPSLVVPPVSIAHGFRCRQNYWDWEPFMCTYPNKLILTDTAFNQPVTLYLVHFCLSKIFHRIVFWVMEMGNTMKIKIRTEKLRIYYNMKLELVALKKEFRTSCS